MSARVRRRRRRTRARMSDWWWGVRREFAAGRIAGVIGMAGFGQQPALPSRTSGRTRTASITRLIVRDPLAEALTGR